MISTGAILFYAGIAGLGLTVCAGLGLLGLLQKSKQRLKKQLKRKYEEE